MTELVGIEAHFIGDYSNCPVSIPAVSVERVHSLIRQLSRTHEPIGATDLARHFREGHPLPDRCFHLTFDDGIRDHVTAVLPILEQYGLQGSFFVPGSIFVEDGRLPLLERQRFLQYAFGSYHAFLDSFVTAVAGECEGFRREDIEPSLQNIARIGGYLSQFSFYTDEERFYRYLRDKVLPPEDFARVIDAMFARRFESDREIFERYYLSRADLRKLHESGMAIGGHGHLHQHLPRLADQRSDILKGLDILEAIIGERPTSFCYPFGTYDRATVAIMRDIGMTHAFTTGAKVADLAICGPYEITRIDIGDWDGLASANGLRVGP